MGSRWIQERVPEAVTNGVWRATTKARRLKPGFSTTDIRTRPPAGASVAFVHVSMCSHEVCVGHALADQKPRLMPQLLCVLSFLSSILRQPRGHMHPHHPPPLEEEENNS